MNLHHKQTPSRTHLLGCFESMNQRVKGRIYVFHEVPGAFNREASLPHAATYGYRHSGDTDDAPQRSDAPLRGSTLHSRPDGPLVSWAYALSEEYYMNLEWRRNSLAKKVPSRQGRVLQDTG